MGKLGSALAGVIALWDAILTLRTWDLAVCIPSSAFLDERGILPLALALNIEECLLARATKHLLALVDDVAKVPSGRALVYYLVESSVTDRAGCQSAYFAQFAHSHSSE